MKPDVLPPLVNIRGGTGSRAGIQRKRESRQKWNDLLSIQKAVEKLSK